DRAARADLARLPALRRPARRAAHAPAAAEVLRAARADAGRAQQEAPRLGRAEPLRWPPGARAGPRPDELPEDAVEVQHGVQRQAPVRRPRSAGDVRAAPAPPADRQAEAGRALRPPAG